MNFYLEQIIFIAVLFMFAALFAASETAFFSLKKSQVHRFSHSERRSEKIVHELMRKPSGILITILAGNLLVHILMSSFATTMFLEVTKNYGHILTIAIITPLVIIFGEITPKVIALGDPVYYSKIFSHPMRFFHRILYPFRAFFSFIMNPLVRFLGISYRESLSVTQEEIESTIDESEIMGSLNPEEAEFIRNVMRFSHKSASNIMIPRNHAVFISDESTVKDAIDVFHETGVVRAPVYSGNPDTVVGLLDARDIIPSSFNPRKVHTSIKKFILPIQFYPATKNVGNLLNEFLSQKIQISVVVDEFGGTAGIVTLSSLITEILGREFSLSEIDSQKEIRETDRNNYIVDGEIQLSDFNIFFEENLESNESDTLAGFVIEHTGHFPSRNSIVETENLILRVRSIRKNRIETFEVRRKEERQ
jgi:putative hemolysin